MRTFHTGGVASAEDITQGLPRVVELFEARSPRGKAEIARIAGRVEIEDTDKGRVLRIKGSRDQVDEHELPRGARLFRADDGSIEIADGVDVEVGQQLTVGAIDPHELLEVLGVRAAQLHLVKEVQDVYRSQGVPIHDKHVELIVRQMFRRVHVVDPGDTSFLPGDNIDRVKFKKENDRVLAEGGQPAAGRQMLMGITKASLATDSWLSAASFQETTRVLTEAALESASDPLVGLKENVIIGKLIPAGTGLPMYRAIDVGHTEMPEQALPADIAEFLASTESYEGDGSWGFDGGWDYESFGGDASQQ
jgi:DNA-directed RNA polymerase subunit beta'